jgi:hypothetical protein
MAHSHTRAESRLKLPEPNPGFEPIAVMAAQVDRCTVNGEEVIPQPGGFYDDWITSWIVGPFKGIPGSTGVVDDVG